MLADKSRLPARGVKAAPKIYLVVAACSFGGDSLVDARSRVDETG